tara:strand:+ start:243 stop:368 length:126 start_codon:yes stop_codon:yes gene_type:complete
MLPEEAISRAFRPLPYILGRRTVPNRVSLSKAGYPGEFVEL